MTNNLLGSLINNLEWVTRVFTMQNIWIVLLISVLNGVLMLFASHRYMLALQQLGYKGRKYFGWLKTKGNNQLSRLLLLTLMSFLFFCVFNLSMTAFFKPSGKNGTLSEVPAYLGFIVYLFFMFAYIITESKVRAKIPLRITRRFVRLAVTQIFLSAVVTFGLLLLINFVSGWLKSEVIYILRYALISVIPILAPFVLLLSNVILKPFEKLNEKHYMSIAKAKLSNSQIIKIGITGSFGKTGVKAILTTILSEKFRVLATPKSYNTPLGISLAIQKLDSTHDIFIAEMGARRVGEISDLATMVNPDIAVLTGINEQHLETFSSVENIKKTKFELFEHLKKGGKGFFSCDNNGSKELYDSWQGEKYLAGITATNGNMYAKDIKITAKGSVFTLCADGKEIECTTSLLGTHNITNICLATCVAYELGLSLDEIRAGINKIRTVTHRLSIVPNNKGIIIVDDSYNSNMDGLKGAIEVISQFEGRKIIVTPGLVELGDKQVEMNIQAGKLIANAFDKVIVVGKTNAEALVKGLLEGGKTGEDVLYEKNSERGNEALNTILQTGDVVLFENDLPDTYY